MKRSLGHTDRKRGQAAAMEAASRLASNREVYSGARLTIRTLVDNYYARGLAGRTATHCAEVRRKLEMWVRVLGPDRLVASLSRSDVELFAERRRLEAAPRVLSDTTLWHDLVALKTALNFAVDERGTDGSTLLPANPLGRVALPKTTSPNRPVARDEYRNAILEVQDQLDWRFALALALACSTGHRIGAILQLRWIDIVFTTSDDEPFGTIRWRAEFDKVSNEHVVPMSSEARDALESAQRSLPAIGRSLVFPSPTNPDQPLDRHLLSRWLRKAEKLAGVSHALGRGWHAFRRGWASDKLHLPEKAVAKAGGWKDVTTMREAYQHATAKDVLAVVCAG